MYKRQDGSWSERQTPRGAGLETAGLKYVISGILNKHPETGEYGGAMAYGESFVGGFAVLVHSQPGRTDWITDRNRFRGFCAAWIEGNKCLALIDRFHGVVDDFRIVALVGKEGAFLQRNRLIRGREDLSGDGGIGDIARRGQLVERQAGRCV